MFGSCRMKSKNFLLIKVVLCIAALTMVTASPAFAIPSVDGKISVDEYSDSFSINFEIEGIEKDAPNITTFGDTGTLYYHQDSGTKDLFMAFIQPLSLVDNVYGPGTPVDYTGKDGVPKEHKFTDLTGSDKAQFKFSDSQGTLILDFTLDYLEGKGDKLDKNGEVEYEKDKITIKTDKNAPPITAVWLTILVLSLVRMRKSIPAKPRIYWTQRPQCNITGTHSALLIQSFLVRIRARQRSLIYQDGFLM